MSKPKIPSWLELLFNAICMYGLLFLTFWLLLHC